MWWRGCEWFVAGLAIVGCGSSSGASAPAAGSSGTGAVAGSGGSGGALTTGGSEGGGAAGTGSGGRLGNGAAGSSGGDRGSGGSGGMSGSGGEGGANEPTSWLRQFGSANDEGTLSVGVDSQGNVVSLHNNGNLLNGLVRKFDASGNELWTVETKERLGRLAVALDGSVFAVGSVVVDEAGKRSSQALLLSYDSSGAARFRTTFGTMGLDTAGNVAAGDGGHCFVLWNRPEAIDGAFNVLSEFDAAGTQLASAGLAQTTTYLSILPDRRGNAYAMGADPEFYIRKFNPHGDVVWTTHIPGRPSAQFADNDENLFFTIASPASFSRIDPSGQLVQSQEFGGTDEWAGLVATDSKGNVFVSSSSMPGARATYDALVYRFDPKGNELGRWSIASDAYDFISELAVDPSGAVIVAGRTEGTLPGQTNLGGADAFVARIQP